MHALIIEDDVSAVDRLLDFRGRRPLEADRLSEIHSVSIETTRTHIRNIYAKLQVRSREGLFHRLRPYRV